MTRDDAIAKIKELIRVEEDWVNSPHYHTDTLEALNLAVSDMDAVQESERWRHWPLCTECGARLVISSPHNGFYCKACDTEFDHQMTMATYKVYPRPKQESLKIGG